jgi:hypothetical protein
LNNDQWNPTRIPCVESWPDGWDDGHGDIAKEWQDFVSKEKSGDKYKADYAKRKKELCKGFALSAPTTYQSNKKYPDAFFAVMATYFRMGKEAFHAEKQQKPIKAGITIYNLTVRTITDRTDPDRQPGVVPEWALRVLAISDINPSYAISTVVLGFGPDQRSAVLWYGTHPMHCPKELTDAEKKTEVMNQLAAHGRDLAKLPCMAHGWMIDGGGTPENTVIDFAANSVRICGIPAITAFGRGGKAYRHPLRKETGIAVHEQAYTKRVSGGRQWVIWNADYWREQSQRAWTGTLGAPGSCDLPRGSHRDFAEQIVSEQLIGKVELNGRMVYDWKHTPNQPHDYGDCMAMGYCFAAVQGIGTGGGGSINRTAQRRTTGRKVRHVTV